VPSARSRPHPHSAAACSRENSHITGRPKMQGSKHDDSLLWWWLGEELSRCHNWRERSFWCGMATGVAGKAAGPRKVQGHPSRTCNRSDCFETVARNLTGAHTIWAAVVVRQFVCVRRAGRGRRGGEGGGVYQKVQQLPWHEKLCHAENREGERDDGVAIGEILV